MKINTTIPVILASTLIISCDYQQNNQNLERDFRGYMRDFVISIAEYSKSLNSQFFIIPQNGQELLMSGQDLSEDYINAIDGVGREDLNYGYNGDNQSTPVNEREYMLDYLILADSIGLRVMITDYCSSQKYMDSSYLENYTNHFISFAADHRSLDNIPDYPTIPYHENNDSIFNLNDARNFLYLINPDQFTSKESFLSALGQTNFDILLIDLFFNDMEELSISDINRLKTKNNGSNRLVIAYMSIGEAENYRFYWQSEWDQSPPEWLGDENPDWEGNYKVQYWKNEWQQLIYGNEDSYIKKIIDAGFDGVYLDIIDAFEYYENL